MWARWARRPGGGAAVHIRHWSSSSCDGEPGRRRGPGTIAARHLVAALWEGRSSSSNKVQGVAAALNRQMQQQQQRLDAATVGEVLEYVRDVDVGLCFFHWASKQPSFRHSSESVGGLLKVFVKSGRHRDGYSLFKERLLQHCDGGYHAYHVLIKGFAHAGELEQAERIRKEAVAFGMGAGASCNSVLQGICNHDLDKGLEFFRKMHKYNTVAYNIVLRLCFKAGRIEEAYQLIDDMGNSGCTPSSMTYSIIVDGLCEVNRVEEAYEFYQEMDRAGLGPTREDKHAGFGFLVVGLLNSGKAAEAVDVFHRLIHRGARLKEGTYRAVINELCRLGNWDCAREVFATLLRGKQGRGAADSGTWAKMIAWACRLGRLEEALELLGSALDHDGLLLPKEMLQAYRTLVDALESNGKLDDAAAFVLQRRSGSGAAATAVLRLCCCPIIAAYCRSGRHTEALSLYKEFNDSFSEEEPKEFAALPLMEALCRDGEVDSAMELYHFLGDRRRRAPGRVFTALIDALCKAERLEEARAVFGELTAAGRRLQAADYHPLLAGLFRCGRGEEAVALLRAMAARRVAFTDCTLSIAVDGLSHLGLFDAATEMLEEAELQQQKQQQQQQQQLGISSAHVNAYSGLIHALCKSGRIDEGLRLYDRVGAAADNVLHCIALDALCKSGRLPEACRLFERLWGGTSTPVNDAGRADSVNVASAVKHSDGVNVGDAGSQSLVNGASASVHNALASAMGGLRVNVASAVCGPRVSAASAVCGPRVSAASVANAPVSAANAMLGGLLAGRHVEAAAELLARYRRPNRVTYNVAAAGLCRAGHVEAAVRLLRHVMAEEERRGEAVADVVAFNFALSRLCRLGRLEAALQLCEEMRRPRRRSFGGCAPCVVTYNTLISALADDGRYAEAEALFNEMLTDGCKPDAITFHILKRMLSRQTKC